MRVTSNWIVLVIVLLAAVGCQETILLPTSDPKPVRIILIDPVEFVGNTVKVTSQKDSLIQDPLLYYWFLGDDSSFSVSRDTLSHVYTAPGYYTITLTVRKASDGSLIGRDTAIAEILDTGFLDPGFAVRYKRVSCTIGAVFKSVIGGGQPDTVLKNTVYSFAPKLEHKPPIYWEADSFYVEDRYSFTEVTSLSTSSRGSHGLCYGSIPIVNLIRGLKFSLITGSYSSSASKGGYSSSNGFTEFIKIHLLPLYYYSNTEMVFRAEGKRAVEYIKHFERSGSYQQTVAFEYHTFGNGSIRLAPEHEQTDSSFVEVRFLR